MSQSPDAVVKTIEVDCPQDRAFFVWTELAGSWWPGDHRPSRSAASTIVIERRVGGRIFERAEEGTENEWGRITAWEPPARFAFDFYFGGGREQPSHVTVVFTSLAGGRTEVRLTHRPGALPEARWSTTSQAYERGWGAALPRYVDTCRT